MPQRPADWSRKLRAYTREIGEALPGVRSKTAKVLSQVSTNRCRPHRLFTVLAVAAALAAAAAAAAVQPAAGGPRITRVPAAGGPRVTRVPTLEVEALAAINKLRREHGLPPVRASAALASAAQ